MQGVLRMMGDKEVLKRDLSIKENELSRLKKTLLHYEILKKEYKEEKEEEKEYNIIELQNKLLNRQEDLQKSIQELKDQLGEL